MTKSSPHPLFSLALFLPLFLFHTSWGRSGDLESYGSIRNICASRRLSYPPPHLRIVIYKSERSLEVHSGPFLLRQYHVVFGTKPIQDKQEIGDNATPEGGFYVCRKNPMSRFYRFIGISYPNSEDALRGLVEGLITPNQYTSILSALGRGVMPPWNTRLGGNIGIHGGGTGVDWTWGCIAMSNRDIEEIYELVQIGTPVFIRRTSRIWR